MESEPKIEPAIDKNVGDRAKLVQKTKSKKSVKKPKKSKPKKADASGNVVEVSPKAGTDASGSVAEVNLQDLSARSTQEWLLKTLVDEIPAGELKNFLGKGNLTQLGLKDKFSSFVTDKLRHQSEQEVDLESEFRIQLENALEEKSSTEKLKATLGKFGFVMSVFGSRFINEQLKRHEMKDRHPAAFDNAGATAYLKQSPCLRAMLWIPRAIYSWRTESAHQNRMLITFTVFYFLLALYVFPASYLLLDYWDDYYTVWVKEIFDGWEMWDGLITACQLCLVVYCTATIPFLAVHANLEIIGSMYNKLVEEHRQNLGKANTSGGSFKKALSNPSLGTAIEESSDSHDGTIDDSVGGSISSGSTLCGEFCRFFRECWKKDKSNPNELNRFMEEARSRHAFFLFFGYIFLSCITVFALWYYALIQTAYERDRDYSEHNEPGEPDPWTTPPDYTGYWFVHLLLITFVSAVGASNTIAIALIVGDTTKLMSAHIRTFEETVSLVCFRALILKSKGQDIANDGMMLALKDKLTKYETYLTTVALATKKTWEAGLNMLVFTVLAMYFFIAFFLYDTFLQEYADDFRTCDQGCMIAIFILMSTIVSVIPATYPLFCMVRQADTWRGFTDRLAGEPKEVLDLLNDTNAEYNTKITTIQKKYQELQSMFTWRIFDYPLSSAAIYKTVTFYLALLWASIVLPGIQKYYENTLDGAKAKLASVVADATPQ